MIFHEANSQNFKVNMILEKLLPDITCAEKSKSQLRGLKFRSKNVSLSLKASITKLQIEQKKSRLQKKGTAQAALNLLSYEN